MLKKKPPVGILGLCMGEGVKGRNVHLFNPYNLMW